MNVSGWQGDIKLLILVLAGIATIGITILVFLGGKPNPQPFPLELPVEPVVAEQPRWVYFAMYDKKKSVYPVSVYPVYALDLVTGERQWLFETSFKWTVTDGSWAFDPETQSVLFIRDNNIYARGHFDGQETLILDVHAQIGGEWSLNSFIKSPYSQELAVNIWKTVTADDGSERYMMDFFGSDEEIDVLNRDPAPTAKVYGYDYAAKSPPRFLTDNSLTPPDLEGTLDPYPYVRRKLYMVAASFWDSAGGIHIERIVNNNIVCGGYPETELVVNRDGQVLEERNDPRRPHDLQRHYALTSRFHAHVPDYFYEPGYYPCGEWGETAYGSLLIIEDLVLQSTTTIQGDATKYFGPAFLSHLGGYAVYEVRDVSRAESYRNEYGSYDVKLADFPSLGYKLQDLHAGTTRNFQTIDELFTFLREGQIPEVFVVSDGIKTYINGFLVFEGNHPVPGDYSNTVFLIGVYPMKLPVPPRRGQKEVSKSEKEFLELPIQYLKGEKLDCLIYGDSSGYVSYIPSNRERVALINNARVYRSNSLAFGENQKYDLSVTEGCSMISDTLLSDVDFQKFDVFGTPSFAECGGTAFSFVRRNDAKRLVTLISLVHPRDTSCHSLEGGAPKMQWISAPNIPQGYSLEFVMVRRDDDGSREIMYQTLFEDVKVFSQIPTPEEVQIESAMVALNDYFSNLANGKYREVLGLEEANDRYVHALRNHGSGFATLHQWNPDVDPTDHVELLRRGCEVNGWQCFGLSDVLEKKLISPGLVWLKVQFYKDQSLDPLIVVAADGTVKTDFDFLLQDTGDHYIVLTPPVYAP